MDRLTKKKFNRMEDFCFKKDCDLYESKGCCSYKRYERLAAYEDTGLSPEEIQEAVDLFKDFQKHVDVPKELKSWVERCTWHVRKCDELQKELNRYKKAEAEGRLIVMPCKVGDTVYVVHGWDDVRIVEDGCAGFNIDCDGVNIIPKMWDEETDGSARAVCATREEAESVKAKTEEECRGWQERKEREFIEECEAKGLDPVLEKQRRQETRSYFDRVLLRYAKIYNLASSKIIPKSEGKTVEFRRWVPFDAETLLQDEPETDEEA